MLLKILLTPLLILLCAGVTRRWGTFLGGAVAGLPLISGPTSFFLTLEQGPAFAAAASYNTLLGVVACAATALAYPWLAVWGLPWFEALPLSLAGFFVTGWLVLGLPHAPWLAVVLALAMPVGILALLPAAPAGPPPPPHPLAARLRLPLQMAWGAALVLGVTAAGATARSGLERRAHVFSGHDLRHRALCARFRRPNGRGAHHAGLYGGLVRLHCLCRGHHGRGWSVCRSGPATPWPATAALVTGAGVTLQEERRFGAAVRGKEAR